MQAIVLHSRKQVAGGAPGPPFAVSSQPRGWELSPPRSAECARLEFVPMARTQSPVGSGAQLGVELGDDVADHLAAVRLAAVPGVVGVVAADEDGAGAGGSGG